MTDLAKIPVTVITGFLGSGKTTLIRHLMTNSNGRRLAILVNEFGTVGVDGDILKSCADEDCPAENIVELANGCICCTVADDFIPTIEALMAMPVRPDHILIETSGLALPKPLLKAFDWPAIRSKITVDGVIALADAEAVAAGRFASDVAAVDAQRLADDSLDHETPLAEVFEDQISCADIILMSKADLAGPDGLSAARKMIEAQSPRKIPILEMTEGVIDPNVILGLNAAAEDDLAARPSHHDGADDHEHDDFETVIVPMPEVADVDALVAAIERLANEQHILRIKGYVAVQGKPMRLLVQAVGARVRHQFDRPWGDDKRAGHLVVIAEHDHIDSAKIRSVLGPDTMHVVFRESHGLEDTDTPFDPGQTPADLVVLSFSDSDLGAFAAGWHRGGGPNGDLPTLRLCNLVALRHPASVDNYIETTLTGAKGILIRLIGGENYWPYGVMHVQDFARRNNIALAILPADGRIDAGLDAHSTLPVSTLRRLSHLCDTGGPVAAQAALAQLALAAGLYTGPVLGAKTVPDCGFYDPENGIVPFTDTHENVVAVTFYRSYLLAADTAPVDALITALRDRGLNAIGVFVPSLKAESAREFLKDAFAQIIPAAIVNATAFSGRGSDGTTPLDTPECLVFQVALSTARRGEWAESERGLSPADLAMHVVLPEVDGRIFTGVVSFKAPIKKDPDLQFSRFAHRAETDRINAVADRVLGWHNLASTPAQDRKIALVLSTYPGREDQIAHAVGLDALASLEDMLLSLAGAGYSVQPDIGFGKSLHHQSIAWSHAAYQNALKAVPQQLRDDLKTAWGRVEDDPLFADGAFHFPAQVCGNALVALQPERGAIAVRDTDYHDLARVPRHSYVAFYLWLRAQGHHALVHIGAHGTLEWLPGKSVALSDDCWPETLTGAMPVIYPFIVNDPGEAAQAKRRIGAVTLGHLPPPMADSAVPNGLLRLEGLLDEYSSADGLDGARRDRLIDMIRSEAQAAGVEADLGLDLAASPAEAMTRIDRFVCDIKESQFGDGLHIFGAAQGETEGLLLALDGRRVPAGPSGSPYRGRTDVLPTGRNLYSVDPRAVPSRVAYAQGVKLAEELLRRHLQDKGDWPKGLVVDLWGSATMRTAGEEVAMAMHLAGLAPKWDENSDRVSGYEILPLALLKRPRIDVTLRVSGLFRDIFPGLAQVFEAGAKALSQRDEDPDMNPYLTVTPRVFGPKPGLYGVNIEGAIEDYSDEGRAAAGKAWLTASEWAIDAQGTVLRDRAALEAQLHKADGFAHVQDLLESDVLLASDYASHEGGFVAAMAHIGAAKPAVYHVDHTRAGTPRARTLPEEIARVVRARAANPDWASGMMRHGFRGAAEVTATLDNLAAFAHLTRDVPAHLFDLYYDATLGRDDLVDFMAAENPAALDAMRARFAALRDAGLWVTLRNSINAEMDAALG